MTPIGHPSNARALADCLRALREGRAWSINGAIIVREDFGARVMLATAEDAPEWDALRIPVEAEGAYLTECLLRRLVADAAAYRRQRDRRDRVARRGKQKRGKRP